tara:strand:+ start:685 stop:1485 length:801 start_codon:yes stop_codon:yes gene_type:complete
MVLDSESNPLYVRDTDRITELPLFSANVSPSHFKTNSQGILLGDRDGELIFCFDSEAMGPEFMRMTEPVDSRLVAQNLSPVDSSIFLMARALNLWSVTVKFCGRCGSATEQLAGGVSYRCGSESCRTKHYPKIDPAVIMLVTNGDDQVALGRGRRHPEGMFSCFAGFLEPGESIEDAVIREVKEESGLNVYGLQYYASQAWPYPAAIMIGFVAQVRKTELVLDPDEILEGRWFSRSELEAANKSGSQMLPRQGSLARQLLDYWLNK